MMLRPLAFASQPARDWLRGVATQVMSCLRFARLACVLGAPIFCAQTANAQADLARHAPAVLVQHSDRANTSAADSPFTLRQEDAPAFTDWGLHQRALASRYSDVTGWLTPDRPASLGLTLGVLTPGTEGRSPNVPLAYDLGIRLRSRLEQRVHLDLHAWARSSQSASSHDAVAMVWSREPTSAGTRVEVQWKASRTSGLVPEFGAIGVQLQGDARLLLRARHGGPMVYYRTKF